MDLSIHATLVVRARVRSARKGIDTVVVKGLETTVVVKGLKGSVMVVSLVIGEYWGMITNTEICLIRFLWSQDAWVIILSRKYTYLN